MGTELPNKFNSTVPTERQSFYEKYNKAALSIEKKNLQHHNIKYPSFESIFDPLI